MKSNKVVKSVAFNKRNPNEKQILDAVKRRNFSKYVKELLLDDLKKKGKLKFTEHESHATDNQQYGEESHAQQFHTHQDYLQHNEYHHYYQNPHNYPSNTHPQNPIPDETASEQLSRMRRDWR